MSMAMAAIAAVLLKPALRAALSWVSSGTAPSGSWRTGRGKGAHERPRLPFGGSGYLPMLMLLYPILSVIVGSNT